MIFLRSTLELLSYIEDVGVTPGCLADTGFLYALAYDDDRLFEKANDVLDALSLNNIPIYANVISRIEFVDLIFRKQVTNGCIELLSSLKKDSFDKPIYKILKDIRDKDTAERRNNKSYKIDENRLKRLRGNLEQIWGASAWQDFCSKFVGKFLVNEWLGHEEDIGLNFVEVLEGQTSDLFPFPLVWKDMVEVMGLRGLRGADAMIVNLFSKSTLPLLITSDSDFENCFSESSDDSKQKAIFIFES